MTQASRVVNLINRLIDWLQLQLNEIKSLDHLTIFIMSLMILIATPIVQYLAWFGLAYSAWSMWKTFNK